MAGRKPIMENPVRIHLYLNDTDKKHLQILSQKSGESVNALINKGIACIREEYASMGCYSDIIESEERTRDMLANDGQQHDTKIIAFTNHKGGVAKTTTCAAMAVLAGNDNKRVLVIDLDNQMNTSDMFGYPLGNKEPSVIEYFKPFFDDEDGDAKSVILSTRYQTIDIITSSNKLTPSFEQEIRNVSAVRGDLLGRLLNDIRELNLYDYVFIDTPPSIGVLVTSTYQKADYLVVPTEADKYSLDGILEVANAVSRRKRDKLPVAEIAGIVFTRTESRTSMAKSIPTIKGQLNDVGVHCFNTFIPKCADVPKSRAEGRPVTDKYPTSTASKKYRELLSELEGIINGI